MSMEGIAVASASMISQGNLLIQRASSIATAHLETVNTKEDLFGRFMVCCVVLEATARRTKLVGSRKIYFLAFRELANRDLSPH